ncbi:hypothetical protein SLE2022_190220 [Rubroshorea leprosula]
MVKSSMSTQLHQEEEDDDVYDDLVARNDSATFNRGEAVKVEGKVGEQKANTHRSKHSETEQRRRSKINERFQALRDLIPQSDQKRDKASLLLEVIEYIHFLQEKLQTYEGSSYQGWVQEPAKLIPWRNCLGPAETLMDHSQIMKNGSGGENNVIAPAMLTNSQNSTEPDLGTASVYKALDHPAGAASLVVPLNLQTQSNPYTPHGRDSIPTEPLHNSTSDAENMVYQPQLQSWQGGENETENALSDNALNEQEDLTIKAGSISLSSVYSQGILCTLTEALQSSGVDLSQASISVQIDVGKRVNSGAIPTDGTSEASSSKPKEMQYLSSQVIAQTEVGVQNYQEDTNVAFKRRRMGTS